jgi:D-sedoheptulose 7-phosphate isomerase
MNQGPPQRRLLQTALQEHLAVMQCVAALEGDIERAAAAIAEALRGDRKMMLCGNGGSAADSLHLAAEFTGRFVHDRRPLAALALSGDLPALTCIANDYSFEEVFARQVRALGHAGDCLLAISTSGHSRNVVRAAQAARERSIGVIGLLGRDGGELRGLCDMAIVVPSHSTARIQEAHSFIGHILCAAVEAHLGVG